MSQEREQYLIKEDSKTKHTPLTKKADEWKEILTFNKHISKSDMEQFPDIYRIGVLSKSERELLRLFCKFHNMEQYYDIIASFCPGSISAYHLFLRNKAKYIKAVNFCNTGALLLAYAIYRDGSSSINLARVFGDSYNHLRDRIGDNIAEINYIEGIVKWIIVKANAFGEKMHSPKLPISKQHATIAFNGLTSLPWEYISFEDGYIYVNLPFRSSPTPNNLRNTYTINEPLANKSWNKIAPFFLKLKRYRVLMSDGQIEKVTSYVPWQDHISIINQIILGCDSRVLSLPETVHRDKTSFTLDEYRATVHIDKNKYLSYLSDIALKGHRVYQFDERISHANNESVERGYAFVIKKDEEGHVYVAFESTNDKSVSTLIFKIAEKKYDKTITCIIKFLQSNKINKRQQLQSGYALEIDHGESVPYRRVVHTDFFSWKSSL